MQLDLNKINCMIFDMDGVITDTADTHASAWKQMFDEYLKNRDGNGFHPFDVEKDYRRFVDGKPRYDGVKSFLDSRDISLPYGSPDDGPDKETICGLGNRKNRLFIDRIREGKVHKYDSSVDLIKHLKARGIRTAVISASRNALEVMKAAGVSELFDSKVDGVDSDKLNLKGKPAPDIFLEACKQLGEKPSGAAMVEDSLAGIEAGKNGGFSVVIGIDRSGRQYNEMKKRGADIIVKDLSELDIKGDKGNSSEAKPLRSLRSALEYKKDIFERLQGATAVIFLDYDGTLTPIVSRPEKATISKNVKDTLKRLANHYSVTVISGRDLKDVKKMVGVSDIAYAGSHGFDITGPGGKYKNDEAGKPFLKSLDEAESALRNRLDVPNAWVERKRFAIALHYRQVESDQLPRLKRIFKAVASNYDELKTSGGKKVLELRPNVDWDKGKALLHFLENMYADSSRIVPVYIGDDVTDEDAFRAIKNRGLPIVVGKGNRKTLASFSLRDPEEVRKLMEALISEAEKAITENIWIMGYDSFAPEEEKHREALCTLGNGYFATRGAAPESAADGVHYPGTYKAGCYNRLQTEIQGHNLENESLVNLPNWLPLNFRIEDGEWFDITKVNIKEYRQEINLKQGTLSRMIRFIDGKDRDTRVFQRRFVSMSDPHLAGLEVTVSAENWSGNITIRSAIDGSVTNSGVERYRDLNNKHLKPVESQLIDNETIFLQMETNQSHIRIAETARTRIYQNSRKMELSYNLIKKPEYIAQEFSLRLEERKSVTVEKIVSLYTSKDNAISESGIESRKEISRAAGFDGLLERHILSWNHLWERGQILMRDGERVSLIVNLHIFHLFQTVSPHSIDHDFGVPPRGLHGEAYRGHILWDELFIFPFLNFRIPDITRALLMYRYRRLPEARWAARQQGYEGAMYPWQSGSDGQEESQELHLNPRSGRWIPDNSQLQRHINIAIAYNIWMYYQITGNINFLYFYGTEMLVEIARFWASIARYNRAIDRYEILGVMGPDEFHDAYPDSDKPGIDNNSYTNIMVVWTFCRTLEALELLPAHRREALNDKLRIRKEELEHWDDISRKMRVAFHEDGIISQFEDYDKLKEFHWKDYQEKYGNIHRLDRILESEGDTPNRYKLSKQADVLMIFYLLSADELYEIFRRLKYPFESEYIPRNIEYYLKRTSHGSTLSRVVHAWVMARSRRELSWHLFKEALESDVSDIQGGTTSEGIHLGAMAGTVDLVQRCYTGIEARQDRLNLNPYIPKDLKEINFSILYRQHHLYLEIKPGRMTLSAEKYGDEPVSIGFKEKVYQLLPGDTIHFKLGGHKKQ